MNISQLLGITPPIVAPYPSTIPCVNPDLVIGLELETENCGALSASTYSKICGKTNFRMETDGSLRGVAYEFISQPMFSTNALAALDDFFGATKFTDDNYTDRCSVHVHVNCTDLTTQQVSSVALLYTIMEEILFEFVGGDRDTNIYCIPWNQCRQHLDLVNKFLRDSDYILRGWNKYTALNLLPLRSQGTVEFRQMHGTADMEKLTTWINLIGAIFKYAKQTELNNLITQIKELNNTSQYEQFFTSVLGGQLPYNQVYSQRLEEGIIFAKYSLMSYKEGKQEQTPKKTKGTIDEWLNMAETVTNVEPNVWATAPIGFTMAGTHMQPPQTEPAPARETAAQLVERFRRQHAAFLAANQVRGEEAERMRGIRLPPVVMDEPEFEEGNE